jgi:hypothetical protein
MLRRTKTNCFKFLDAFLFVLECGGLDDRDAYFGGVTQVKFYTKTVGHDPQIHGSLGHVQQATD